MQSARQEANRELIELLLNAVEAEPDQRFGQLLVNLGVLVPAEAGGVQDPYNDESTVILRRVQTRVARKSRRPHE